MPPVKHALFKCPQCGEPGGVDRTRPSGPQRVVRYRQCENGHRFTTKEILTEEAHHREDAIGTTRLEFALTEFIKNLGCKELEDLISEARKKD